MSNIVEELRSNKRQLTERSDSCSRRHDDDDNNNNNNGGDYYNASSWKPGRPALTPTSAAAAAVPLSGSRSKSRSRRHRRAAGRAAAAAAAGELCYDEHGALDLTAAAAAARTLNPGAVGRPSVLLSAATINLINDDSAPLDLSLATCPSYVFTNCNIVSK